MSTSQAQLLLYTLALHQSQTSTTTIPAPFLLLLQTLRPLLQTSTSLPPSTPSVPL